MALAGSFTTKEDPVYKSSKRKFNKNALLGNLQNREPGSEKGNAGKGYKERMSKDNKIQSSDATKKEKDEFYNDALGDDYERQENKDTNVKGVGRIALKDFLRMNKKFSYEEPNK